MSHKDHPGFCAFGCKARITVNPAAYSMSSEGYSCKVTGGHCLPNDEKCPKLLKILEERDLADQARYEGEVGLPWDPMA
jgi:hypothetical protein